MQESELTLQLVELGFVVHVAGVPGISANKIRASMSLRQTIPQMLAANVTMMKARTYVW